MLSLFYREILRNGDTATADLFCEQLEKMEPRVSASLVRGGKVLLRPYHAKITQLS